MRRYGHEEASPSCPYVLHWQCRIGCLLVVLAYKIRGCSKCIVQLLACFDCILALRILDILNEWVLDCSDLLQCIADSCLHTLAYFGVILLEVVVETVFTALAFYTAEPYILNAVDVVLEVSEGVIAVR